MVLVFYYIPRLSKWLVPEQGNREDNSADCHSSFHSTGAKTSMIPLLMNEIPLNLYDEVQWVIRSERTTGELRRDYLPGEGRHHPMMKAAAESGAEGAKCPSFFSGY